MSPGPANPYLSMESPPGRDHRARLRLCLNILSYAGKVIGGVRVDEAMTKNPHRFVELYEEEASSMLRGVNTSC